ncbi:MAG: hydrolase, partial [Anaerolineaceae bacterium]|nr:hydrolase [Anaerolineaceae bacterium]
MIIRNANIITCDNEKRILSDASLVIGVDGKITSIYEKNSKDLENTGNEEVIDAHKQFLMPASICAHTHFYGAFSRGMYIPGEAPDAFPAILEKLWWKL